MKHLLIIVAVILLTVGCQDAGAPTSVPEQSFSTGKVYFTFNKVNAPATVQTLTTTLTRSGYAAIEKSINITRDSSATIFFENIAVGTWKVSVDAKNETGKVLYTGASDVVVMEAFISQVNLVLTPVTSGVGSVQINVSWGIPPPISDVWNDFHGNPILAKVGTSLDVGGVGQPKIFYDEGKYYLYYQNYGSPGSIGYAISDNGMSWSRPDSNILLMTGDIGGWNIRGIATGPVYKVDETYYMLFQGYDGMYIQTGISKSFNKLTWVPQSTPILTLHSGEQYIVGCDVEIIGGIYYLYYSVRTISGSTFIGVAVSADGKHWERTKTPLMKQSQAWETGGVMYPSIIKTAEGYLMLYSNSTDSGMNTSFGLATSTDGLTWTKDVNNPVFNKDNTAGHWASGGVLYPYLTIIDSQIRMYYTGITSDGEWQIGFADKK
ncbi:MAG: hypothetical protein WCW35_14760 [Bacteroidota bacterium]|jgi:predicted GH43/DUF377 family glycosyl hydrolase